MLFPVGVLVLTRLEIPIPRFVQVTHKKLWKKAVVLGEGDICKKIFDSTGIGRKLALFFRNTFKVGKYRKGRAWGVGISINVPGHNEQKC